MSAPIVLCCGTRWILSGTWSDALTEATGVARAVDGACGTCKRPLSSRIDVVELCREGLCTATATHRVHVIGGPTLFLCDEHKEKIVAAAREAGVSSKLELATVEAPR